MHLGKHVWGTCHPIHNTNHKGITLVTVSEGRNMGPFNGLSDNVPKQ